MRFLRIFACGALLASGCSHVSYTQAHLDGTTTEYTDSSPERPAQTYKLLLHEFHLYDRTGGLCAGIAEGASKSGARAAEERKMVEENRMHGTYTYKTYEPRQFRGLECGFFYRYGVGNGGGSSDYRELQEFNNRRGYTYFEYDEGEHSLHEFGFHLGAQGEYDYGLFWRFEFRITGGSMDLEAPVEGTPPIPDRVDDGGGFFTIPLTVGFGYAPSFFYGLGLYTWGGIDLMQWQAAFRHERESIVDYFDYGAGANFVVDTPYIKPSFYFGWRTHRFSWGDRIPTHEGIEGRVALDVVWDDFF